MAKSSLPTHADYQIQGRCLSAKNDCVLLVPRTLWLLPPLRGWARSWQIRVALRGCVGENQPKDPSLTPLPALFFCWIKGGHGGQDSPLPPGKLSNCSQRRVGLSQPGRREEAGTKKSAGGVCAPPAFPPSHQAAEPSVPLLPLPIYWRAGLPGLRAGERRACADAVVLPRLAAALLGSDVCCEQGTVAAHTAPKPPARPKPKHRSEADNALSTAPPLLGNITCFS